METQKFVELVKLAVRDNAVSATLSHLHHSPRKRPSADLQKNAAWYQSLDETQRERRSSIVRTAADQAVFGFLCVIDGARAIGRGENKGRLELRYIGERAVVLNPADGPLLHDFC